MGEGVPASEALDSPARVRQGTRGADRAAMHSQYLRRTVASGSPKKRSETHPKNTTGGGGGGGGGQGRGVQCPGMRVGDGGPTARHLQPQVPRGVQPPFQRCKEDAPPPDDRGRERGVSRVLRSKRLAHCKAVV